MNNEPKTIGYTLEPVNELAFDETCKNRTRQCAGCKVTRVVADFSLLACPFCGSTAFINYIMLGGE